MLNPLSVRGFRFRRSHQSDSADSGGQVHERRPTIATIGMNEMAAFDIRPALAEHNIDLAPYPTTKVLLHNLTQPPGLVMLYERKKLRQALSDCRALWGKWSELPIALVFANAAAGDEELAFREGVRDFIDEGVRPTALAARLAARLRDAHAHQELWRRYRDTNQFADTLAHDVRHQLSVIHDEAHQMQMDSSMSARRLRGADVIRESVEDIQVTTDALLTLARSRGETIVRSNISMAPLIRRSLARLDNAIRCRRAEIEMTAELPMAQGVDGWLQQVWDNLISNAVRFGGDPPRIYIGGERPNHLEARFWIRDNGHAMKPSTLRHLRDFFADDEPVEAAAPPELIGLTIVRRVINKLGGRLGAELVPQGGCKFWFTLPHGASV
ncbi:MAG: HAMP domain-containing histidine kinase [Planctomycetales bacterium]|nr:HAMP domain-containing histidine kinase [Planctomycetales bacterium]